MGEQDRRFMARITDPLRQWKLSPMDLEAYCDGMNTPRPATRCWRQRTLTIRLGTFSFG